MNKPRKNKIYGSHRLFRVKSTSLGQPASNPSDIPSSRAIGEESQLVESQQSARLLSISRRARHGRAPAHTVPERPEEGEGGNNHVVSY